MKLKYASAKLKEQCNKEKEAKKLLGGNVMLAISLLARINALEAAETLQDIIVQPQYHFPCQVSHPKGKAIHFQM